MTEHVPILDAAEVERVIRNSLPMMENTGFVVESVAPGVATVRFGYRPWMLRPGGSVSGPVLMMAADTAMFAVILAHVGAEVMMLTANLNINFLRRAAPGDVLAEGRLLKLGRRLAVVEVLIRSDSSDALVAHVTGNYVLPWTNAE